MADQRTHIQKHDHFEATGNRYRHPLRPYLTGHRAYLVRAKASIRSTGWPHRCVAVFHLPFHHGGLSRKVWDQVGAGRQGGSLPDAVKKNRIANALTVVLGLLSGKLSQNTPTFDEVISGVLRLHAEFEQIGEPVYVSSDSVD